MAVLQQFMTKNVKTCNPTDDIRQVASIMHEEDVGMVPVEKDGNLIGCVTDRDIVIKGLARDLGNNICVEDIMTEKVISGKPDMPVEDASLLMQDHQIRRLMIIDHGKLKGIVSIGDLAASKQADQVAGNALSEISR
ncbi:CBS domain-containing protein [Alkalihalobacillus sp. TS-13]|uniref:CBS domain-containing protein n=1 Tax=Alkalihalobacillus sp. TS-13 TaxID=2842455 RepID=UPI001C87A595|nr:CBS domain-containing protein [Alkalihalobacillus sp. TS-13]